MSVDFLPKNFPPFQVHHAKKPPRFYPDGFQRNVIDFYFIFSDCRLRKALYLQFSYFIWPLGTDILAEQLNTYVAKDGTNFSGGQRQRILLARLLYKNPDIIILDESTRSLDTAASNELQKIWETVYADRTVIFITHKLYLLKPNDKVAYLHEGQLAYIDTHERLQKNNKSYQQLLALSIQEEKDEKRF